MIASAVPVKKMFSGCGKIVIVVAVVKNGLQNISNSTKYGHCI
jgi:hypothetical protein